MTEGRQREPREQRELSSEELQTGADGLPDRLPDTDAEEAAGDASEVSEIRAFADAAWARITRSAAVLKDPHADPQGALEVALDAWRLVRALCDELGLAVVAVDGVVCSLEPREQPPAAGPREGQNPAPEAVRREG